MNDPILEMRGVSKSFFGIKALRAVDLTVYPGEIHALMGENGAGKSHDPEAGRGHPVLSAIDMSDGQRVKGCSLTVHAGEVVGLAGLIGAGRTELAHLIIGAAAKTSGRLELEGRPIDIRTPGEALEAGIAYLTEDRKALGLFLDMSCLDNINLAVLGRDAKLGWFLDGDKARERADRAFAGLSIRAANVGVPAGGLSGGNQQKVLLSRLLAIAPKILILDEPTRGVDVGAKSEIYSIIDNLAKAAPRSSSSRPTCLRSSASATASS
ncbi:ABC-type sugar transport system ATPase subunit [Bradyrhizobium diazoefficiens]